MCRAAPRGGRRSTRGRALVTLLLAACSLLVAPSLLQGHGVWKPEIHVAYAKRATYSYTVKRGDTLWSIAHRLAPGRDPRPVIDRLIADNHLSGTLQAGQSLDLPAPIR
jgi:LysM domain